MQAAYGTDLFSIPFETFPAQDRAGELRLYVEHGVRPSAALMALLCADGQSAFALGDAGIRVRLGDIIAWFHEHLPIACYGSSAVVQRWLAAFDHRAAPRDVPTFCNQMLLSAPLLRAA